MYVVFFSRIYEHARSVCSIFIHNARRENWKKNGYKINETVIQSTKCTETCRWRLNITIRSEWFWFNSDLTADRTDNTPNQTGKINTFLNIRFSWDNFFVVIIKAEWQLNMLHGLSIEIKWIEAGERKRERGTYEKRRINGDRKESQLFDYTLFLCRKTNKELNVLKIKLLKTSLMFIAFDFFPFYGERTCARAFLLHGSLFVFVSCVFLVCNAHNFWNGWRANGMETCLKCVYIYQV